MNVRTLLIAVVGWLALAGGAEAAVTQDFDLDETSGTSAVNDVGGGVTGTYGRNATNTTTPGPGGTLGTMQDFDGVNDHVTLGSVVTIAGSGAAGSFSCWVKFDTAADPMIGTAGSAFGRVYKVDNTTFGARSNSSSAVTFAFASGIGTAAYRHVVFTRSAAGTGHIYMDGVDSDSGGVSITGAFAVSLIGNMNGDRLNGKIGGVRFFDTELSSGDVATLYAEGTGGGGGGGSTVPRQAIVVGSLSRPYQPTDIDWRCSPFAAFFGALAP